MEHPPAFSRRSFVGMAASATALLPLAGHAARAHGRSSGSGDLPWLGLKVGLASYSFSKLPLDAAIQGIRTGRGQLRLDQGRPPAAQEHRGSSARRSRRSSATPASRR